MYLDGFLYKVKNDEKAAHINGLLGGGLLVTPPPPPSDNV